MALEVDVFGVKVGCDSPEHAAALAASCSALKKPTAKHVLDAVKGPITVVVDKAKIECPTVETAAATVMSLVGVRPLQSEKSDTKKAQAEGQKKSWKHPRLLAKEFDIHVSEARSLLSEKSKRIRLETKKNPTRQAIYEAVREDLLKRKK